MEVYGKERTVSKVGENQKTAGLALELTHRQTAVSRGSEERKKKKNTGGEGRRGHIIQNLREREVKKKKERQLKWGKAR